jgi:LysM repeat protein
MKKQLLIVLSALVLCIGLVGVAEAAPGRQGGGVHRVAGGETLSSIAMRYGVTVEALMWQNGLANPNMIYVGQPLIIPGGYGNSGGYGASPAAYGCGNSYIVRAGETLSSIALQYGVSVHELAAINGLYNKDIVYIGQRLCLPAGRGYAPSPVGYQNYATPGPAYYHTVSFGETRANNLANPSLIVINQQLIIPGYLPQAPAYVGKPAYTPAPAYAGKPGYAPPPGPPPAPAYDHDPGPAFGPPPPYQPPRKPPASPSEVPPPAPAYQPGPVAPLLPLADHPIELTINGGESWVDEVYPAWPDPNGITTLIVNMDDKTVDPLPVVRLRSGDYEAKGELGLVPEFGIDKLRFVFKYIPPGDYDVWLEDPNIPSNKIPVEVDAGQRVEVAFRKGLAFSGPTFASPDGWYIGAWDNPSKPKQNIGGWSNILIKAPASGLTINIESEGGGYKAKCFTGSKGPGTCDFAGLMAGFYFFWIDGTDLRIKTYMDGNAYATFEFVKQPTPSDQNLIGPVDYPPQ